MDSGARKDSVIITGLYTHMFSVTQLYTKGYMGWFRVHTSVWDELKGLSEERMRASDTAGQDDDSSASI
jgi:hypothetical protein